MPSLSHWAEATPDAVALIAADTTRTFAELDANANRLAHALRRRGIQSGDAIALLCDNRPEFAEVVFAAQRAGLRLTPVNWHLTGQEAGYIVNDCEARAIIVAPDLTNIAAAALQRSTNCTIALRIGGEAAGFESYEAALATEPAAKIEDQTPGTTMMYTSGTTGRPKGVKRKAGATPASRAANQYGYDVEGGSVHLCTGPLYHAAPLGFSLTGPLWFGATVVLMDSWDAEQALRLVEEHKVTHTHMVPTMFHRLLSLPEGARTKYDISSLRSVVHGAAPCPVPVKHRMIDWLGPIISEYYAATEGSGSSVDSETWLTKPGTVGKPVDGQVKIGDEQGRSLPSGEIGLVYLLSPEASRFSCFKDDEKTADSFRGDYFTLGDVGYLDQDGFLFLTDRSANLIISGGVNVYPAEVDAVLLEHDTVGDAATIGVPNEEWGEEVVAVVELQPGIVGSHVLAIELIEHCRQRLAHYKCPRRVEFVDTLPRHDNGKIYKRVLREQFRSAPSAVTALGDA